MSVNAAKCRQSLQQLFNDQMGLLRILLKTKLILKGVVYKSAVKCGRPGCKCAKHNQLHTVWKFTRSVHGTIENRSISFGDFIRYEPYLKNYHKFRQARAKLVKLHKHQLIILNKLEKSISSDAFEKDMKNRDAQMHRLTYWRERGKK